MLKSLNLLFFFQFRTKKGKDDENIQEDSADTPRSFSDNTSQQTSTIPVAGVTNDNSTGPAASEASFADTTIPTPTIIAPPVASTVTASPPVPISDIISSTPVVATAQEKQNKHTLPSNNVIPPSTEPKTNNDTMDSSKSSVTPAPEADKSGKPQRTDGKFNDAPPRPATLSYLLHAASLHDSGRVAFLGSSSNMSLLLEPQGYDTYHFPLPEEISGTSSRLNEMDNEEIEILKFRGAFLLPPRDLCDDIVEAYFEKIHPTIPLVNRTQFMRRYNDPSNPPSLLLLQAILLAGSRVCRNPALLDSTGSSELASLTFYKRVKALYDANYETDRIAIVQSLVLMGWWWEGPEDVTRNSFYWTRVALSVAQGFGLHRSVEKTSMALVDKRMWKRIWWSLFLRDRSAAVALGRPVLINLEDSDVPMITEEDFNEDEPGMPSPYPPNRIHSLFFIHSVKLSEIMGFVLRQHFSVDAENMRRRNKVPSVSHCDMAMVAWMQNLPEELKYKVRDNANHNFFKALLHAQYYTILCLVHRSNILHENSAHSPYPSWGIAFQAAHMIAKIMENMLDYDEPRDCPAFYVYTLFSAMIMLIYQTESPIPAVVESARKALAICFRALKELGRTWLVGRMVLKLFHQLNENKSLRDHFVRSARGASGSSGQRSSRKRDAARQTTKNSTATPITTPATAAQSSVHVPPTAATSSTATATTTATAPALAVPQQPPTATNSAAPTSRGKRKLETQGPNATYPSKASKSKSSLAAPINSVDQGVADLNSQPGSNTTWTSFDGNSGSKSSPAAAGANHVSTPPVGAAAPMKAVSQSSNNAHRKPYNLLSGEHQPASPDFAFVTNTPPQAATFYENFQPSQLFPEPQDSSDGGASVAGPGGTAVETMALGATSNINVSGSGPGTIDSTAGPGVKSIDNDMLLGNSGSLSGFVYDQAGLTNNLPPNVGTSVSPSDYNSSDYNKSSPRDDLGLNGLAGLAGLSGFGGSFSQGHNGRNPGNGSNGSGGNGFWNGSGPSFGAGIGGGGSNGGSTGGFGAPSSLNLGDWYTYLVSTFPGVEDVEGGTPATFNNTTHSTTAPSSTTVPDSGVLLKAETGSDENESKKID